MSIVQSLSVGIGQVFALYTSTLYANVNIFPKKEWRPRNYGINHVPYIRHFHIVPPK